MAAPFSTREPPRLPAAPPAEPVVGPPASWGAYPQPVPRARDRGRGWAAVVFAAAGAIVATIGAFAPWARYADGIETTGIEHGDGWFVLVVAVGAAACAGALAFGGRSLWVRLGVFGSSMLLFFLYGLNRIDVARARDHVTGAHIKVGGGLYGVMAGAVLLLIAAALILPRAVTTPVSAMTGDPQQPPRSPGSPPTSPG